MDAMASWRFNTSIISSHFTLWILEGVGSQSDRSDHLDTRPIQFKGERFNYYFSALPLRKDLYYRIYPPAESTHTGMQCVVASSRNKEVVDTGQYPDF